MIGSLFTAGRFAYAAFSGVDALIETTLRYGIKLALRSRRVDDDTAEAMVAAMRADAPQLTGALVNGIAWHADDETTIVEASALKTTGGQKWDYAAFTEFGTSREAAEPFFYENADAILEARGSLLEEAATAAASDSGF